MKRIKTRSILILCLAAAGLCTMLGGCAVGAYDEDYYGPEWDGGVFIGGVYDRRGWDHDHGDHRGTVFHHEGGHPAAVSSARGNASMGHGGGGGGHAGGGGGGGGGHR